MTGKKVNKNKKNKIIISIIILFLVVLSLRLSFCFQNNSLNKESYYHLSQAENILETGKPGYHNTLYDNSALPITDCILSFFGIFFSLEFAAKILINLFISASVVLIYGIVKEITRNNKISFFAALFTGFIPLLFQDYINNFTSIGVSIFVFLLTLLFFIKSMHNTKYIRHFIISLIGLIILTPLSAVFIAAFIIYFIMLSAEGMKIRASEIEVFLFSLILGGWLYIILYKNVILQKGISFLLHPTIRSTVKTDFLVLGLIGIVPAILGIIGIYFNTVRKSSRRLLFITAFVIINTLFLLFDIVNKKYTLLMISLGLIICSSAAIKEFINFFNRSKIRSLYNVLLVVALILFFITSIVPSFTNAVVSSYDVPSSEDQAALRTLKHESSDEDIVMCSLEDSYVVEYFSDRKTVLSSPSIEQENRLEDVNKFFKINLNTETLRLLTFYDADYVFISDLDNTTLNKFEGNCYKNLYSNKTRVYKVLCTLSEEEELNKRLFEDADK